MTESLVKMENISKKYKFSYALKSVNLTIPKGGIIGLIGANGSGKSTLLKLIAGLIRPSSGDLFVLGQKTSRLTSTHVAFSSDEQSIYDFFTVDEALIFSNSVFPDFDLSRAKEMLHELRLEPEKRVKQLSKGNKGKLKIIITLARDVPLMLLDEPLSGLDPLVREDILKILARYVELQEKTLMISTHEVSEVEPLLDHVLFLKEGELHLAANVEELRAERGQSVLETMKEVFS